MEAFLGIVTNCWTMLGDGVDFLFEHPYTLIGSALGVVSYIIATGKRAIRVSKK